METLNWENNKNTPINLTNFQECVLYSNIIQDKLKNYSLLEAYVTDNLLWELRDKYVNNACVDPNPENDLHWTLTELHVMALDLLERYDLENSIKLHCQEQINDYADFKHTYNK